MKMHLDRTFQALMALTGVLTLAVIAGIVQVLHHNEQINDATQRRYESYLLADELRQSSDDLTRLARTYVVSGDPAWAGQYQEILDIRDGRKPRPAHYERIYWDFRAAGGTPPVTATSVPLQELMKRVGFTPQEFDKLDQAKRVSDDLVRTETVAMNLVKARVAEGRGGAALAADPDAARARESMHDAAYHQNKARIMAPINEFLAMLDERTSTEVAQARQQGARWVWIAIVAAVIEGVVLVASIRWAHRGLASTLGRVRAATQAIAQGDLSRVERGDWVDDVVGQVMRAVQDMRAQLERTIGSIRDGAAHIATGSAEIAAGNNSLSQRTEEQAANLEQTAATMEQMNVTVRNGADAARQAAELADQASAAAERGGAMVGQVVGTMGEISASSGRIADIIGVIDGIAFQTNILALNAAVEAARAGEQGRGFAVVASEVRSLAQRSANAAKEIKTLIHASADTVRGGTQLVDEAGQGMGDLVRQVKHVAQLIGDISTSMVEQSRGIGQVAQAVQALDSVTQQNAALVEESAAASDSLRRQAGALSEAVATFKIGHTG